MSNESFIRAMPKVELNIRLEGAFSKETLMMIADENEISSQSKQFTNLVSAWDNPDLNDLWAHFKSYAEWLQYPDDLTRLVYNAGVLLAKQNIRYAEVSINPGFHLLSGMSFDEMMEAINDGRDRVERGWGTRIAWVLTVSRNEPRLADDTIRWASSATGRKAGIVALGLSGLDSTQPAGQFERAFNTALKKEVSTVVQAGNSNMSDGILDAMILRPSRLVDGWGILDNPDLVENFRDDQIPLVVSLGRAKKHGWIENHADYPLKNLQNEDLKIVLSAEMPNIYGNTLTDEYIIANQECDFSIADLQALSLSAITASFLPTEDKNQLIEEFNRDFELLQKEHLAST